MVLTCVVCAQRRVDPKFRYDRVIAVVPFAGKGTPADPKRPQYAPWPPSKDPNGILAFTYLPSDDGRLAIVEFVARNRAAFHIPATLLRIGLPLLGSSMLGACSLGAICCWCSIKKV